LQEFLFLQRFFGKKPLFIVDKEALQILFVLLIDFSFDINI